MRPSDRADTARSGAEVHGDGQPYPHLHLLEGTPTNSMPLFLDDAQKIMRRAVFTVLAEHTAAHQATAALPLITA